MLGGSGHGAGPRASRVLVRAPDSFRYFGTPVLVLGLVGLALTVRRALLAGGAGHLVGAASFGAADLAGWLLLAFFVPALSVALVFIWTYRELLTPTEASRRFLWSHRRLRPQDATRIRYVPPHETPVRPAAARLDLFGAGQQPVLSYADADPDWPEIVATLHAWVQAHPGLVRDPETASLFAQLEVD